MDETGTSSEVPRYETFELTLTAEASYANPFADVAVTADFTAPSGRTLAVPGFYDGDGFWRVRAAPDEVGTWRYVTRSTDEANSGLHGREGSFECVPSENKGFVRVDPVRKYWFAYADGSPFFGLGDTCYGMVTHLTERERLEYLDTRARQGFNFLRFFVSGYPFGGDSGDPSESMGPELWPWGGTTEEPDYDRLNPRFFQRLDRIFDELHERGLMAEALVFTYYSRPFTDTSVWTAERERLWAGYLIARLAARTGVFLWTVTNEYLLYPDGRYRSDEPGLRLADEWARRMGALFHELDPYGHPTTAHPEPRQLPMGPRLAVGSPAVSSPVVSSPVVSSPDRGKEIDVITQQYHGDEPGEWTGECWKGDAAGIEKVVWNDRTYDKPVINTESCYEYLEGYPTHFNRQVHHTDKCRRAAWRVFMAGGAAYAAGFAGTTHGRNTWKGQPCPITVADQGFAAQLGHYYRFITEHVAFADMRPDTKAVALPNICLSDPGREYVVYAPAGGAFEVDLAGASGEFDARWLDPRTGELGRPTTVSGGARRQFVAPVRVASGRPELDGRRAPGPESDDNDWVLRLKRRNGS